MKKIWDSIIDEDDNSTISAEQLTELHKRRAAYDEGHMPVYIWKDIKDSILKK